MDGVSENTTSSGSNSVGDSIGTPSGLAPNPPSDKRRVVVDVHTHLWHSLDQLGPHAANRIRQQFANEPWDQPDQVHAQDKEEKGQKQRCQATVTARECL